MRIFTLFHLKKTKTNCPVGVGDQGQVNLAKQALSYTITYYVTPQTTSNIKLTNSFLIGSTTLTGMISGFSQFSITSGWRVMVESVGENPCAKMLARAGLKVFGGI